MEAIAAWHEAEPGQEPPGAKPTLQNILQDYAAQLKITPGRKTGMDLTAHGGQAQPQNRDGFLPPFSNELPSGILMPFFLIQFQHPLE